VPGKQRGHPRPDGSPEAVWSPTRSTSQSLPRDIDADAEQVEAARARTLLELAAGYTREALRFPDEVALLRGMVAELLFENAALRHQVDRLAGRVDALERRAGVSR